MAPPFLQTIENGALSTWLRESPLWFGYYFFLSWHVLGIVLLIGTSSIIALRILGVASEVPVRPLARLYPLVWVGFWIQVVSGVFLLIAYPTKTVTNWDFYVKLALIGLAMTATLRLRKAVFDDATLSVADMSARGKSLAGWAIALWIGVVASGRYLAYTAKYQLYNVLAQMIGQ